MREETEAVRDHYDANPQKEWNRLQKIHPYEKYITVHMMDRYIRPGNTILDIGGGPGQYAIHYAWKGHAVTLVDLSSGNVRFAKKKARQYGVKAAHFSSRKSRTSPAISSRTFPAVFHTNGTLNFISA